MGIFISYRQASHGQLDPTCSGHCGCRCSGPSMRVVLTEPQMKPCQCPAAWPAYICSQADPAATGLRTGHLRVPLKCHIQMVSDYGLSGSNAGAAAGGQALWSRPCQVKCAASGSRRSCPQAAPSTLLFLLESTSPGVPDAHIRKAEECLSVMGTRGLKSGSTQKQDHDEENGSGVSWFV